MEAAIKSTLPASGRALVDRIESHCGCKIECSLVPSLTATRGPIGLARPEVLDGKLKLVLLYGSKRPSPELIAHEALHLWYRAVEGVGDTGWGVTPPGLPSEAVLGPNLNFFKLGYWAEHCFLYRDMAAMGLDSRDGASVVRDVLSHLGEFPAGAWRSIGALGCWLHATYCFPGLQDSASARLAEFGLLDQARRFEDLVRPSITGSGSMFERQLSTVAQMAIAAGIRLDHVQILRLLRDSPPPGAPGWWIYSHPLSDYIDHEPQPAAVTS